MEDLRQRRDFRVLGKARAHRDGAAVGKRIPRHAVIGEDNRPARDLGVARSARERLPVREVRGRADLDQRGVGPRRVVVVIDARRGVEVDRDVEAAARARRHEPVDGPPRLACDRAGNRCPRVEVGRAALERLLGGRGRRGPEPCGASGLSLESWPTRSGRAPIGTSARRWDDSGMRRALVVATVGLGVAVGVYALRTARDDPAFSFAGATTGGAVALLVGGVALVGAGAALWTQRPQSRVGPLVMAAGLAWFVLEWKNPGIDSSAAFTVGLCLYAACPAVVAHALLGYPGGLATWVDRAAVALAYVGGVLVLGVLPAFFFDPDAQACTQCPRNLFLITANERAVSDLYRTGVYLGIGWAAVVAVAATAKFGRSSRRSRPVLAGGTVYLALVAAVFAGSRDRG